MSVYFEPGVLLSDEELAARVKLPHWTMTEAFFWLQGQRSPGIEYSEGLRAWYPGAYNHAVRAIETGDLGQKKTRAGESVFIDRPTEWFAWADSLGPDCIMVDERVRRELSRTPDLTDDARKKGGSKRKYDKGLQQFIDWLFDEFKDNGTHLTIDALEKWLVQNASKDEGFDPPDIRDCEDIELYDGRIWWKDKDGQRKNTSLRSVEPYMRRAKGRASDQAT
jgi:hypothetical protein